MVPNYSPVFLGKIGHHEFVVPSHISLAGLAKPRGVQCLDRARLRSPGQVC